MLSEKKKKKEENTYKNMESLERNLNKTLVFFKYIFP